MKRYVSLLMTLVLLAGLWVKPPTVYASEKASESRAIAIVFDNSGSMYDEGDQAWCRATYAMEVFASMLNEGDVLQIYPMHPITIGGQKYTMNSPFIIRNAEQASYIRDIFTEDAGGTPIESVDCAISGLQNMQADKKYMIVLTDGGTFSKNGGGLSKDRTTVELDKRIQATAGPDMTVMYLGIGSEACIPTTQQSEYFVKRQAVNTADVLATLTEMSNLVFGRDTLPKNHISEKTIDFDISISKLIVFVQGDNIADLSVKGEKDAPVGLLTGTRQTQYSTKGAGDYNSVPDTSLQGMMVIYEDCAAGKYVINYTGTATSVEVYYEPDADLDFVFTDSKGRNVDLKSLYEGEYKVSFGMKDGQTGELISSDLLGNPHYDGKYYINGQETTFTHDGYSGEVPISLKMNDTFGADLTVTYLSGYTISKDSSDFGWPDGGVQVLAPPLGRFEVDLNVPQDYILIKEIDDSEKITAELTIEGEKLTAEEFAAVTMAVDTEGVNYTLTPVPEESLYEIQLQNTDGIEEGKYKITANATYLDIAGRNAQADDDAKVKLGNLPLWLLWTIRLGILLLLFIIIWLILHIKVLPKYAHTTRKLSSMYFDGDDVTQATNFMAEIKKKGGKVQAQYGGKKFGITMNVVPGQASFLYKSQKRRSAEVKPLSVRKFGSAKIEEAMIGSVKYVLDDVTGKLVPAIPNQKPFNLTHGSMIRYSGKIQDAGMEKNFEVTSKLSFTKK
ncbi:MAG: hypothetical protein IKU54_04260 [Oscillospiraceae bacterium]|nr:hypothetical protein [Oscillospiraceae bacterium]